VWPGRADALARGGGVDNPRELADVHDPLG
jgi:hypothetical protein